MHTVVAKAMAKQCTITTSNLVLNTWAQSTLIVGVLRTCLLSANELSMKVYQYYITYLNNARVLETHNQWFLVRFTTHTKSNTPEFKVQYSVNTKLLWGPHQSLNCFANRLVAICIYMLISEPFTSYKALALNRRELHALLRSAPMRVSVGITIGFWETGWTCITLEEITNHIIVFHSFTFQAWKKCCTNNLCIYRLCVVHGFPGLYMKLHLHVYSTL